MSETDIRDTYEERPTPIRFLYQSPARQQLVDFFLELARTWDENSEPLTKSDIISATDMQRKSIISHVDVLVETGIVNVNDEHRHERYEPAIESEPFSALVHTNTILQNYYEGDHGKQQE